MTGECKKHGKTDFYLNRPNYWRCKRCNVEAVTARRQEVKRILVEHAGGSCVDCGLRDIPAVFDFHHLDPSKKEFRLGSGNTPALALAMKEVEKCALLCSNCHRKRHAAEYA